MGAPLDAVQEPAKIVLDPTQPGRIELFRQQQSHGSTSLRPEHQSAAFHSLHPALFLIPCALEPPVHGHDLRYRQPLRFEYALCTRALFAGIELGDPDAEGAVGPSQPFQCRIGEQVRGNR